MKRLVLLTFLMSGLLHLAATMPAQTSTQTTPDALSQSPTLSRRTPEQSAEARRVRSLAIINGRPYQQPTQKDKLHAYFVDTYGLPGDAGTTIRALYSQARGRPEGWGQDWPGFGQRFGSSAAVTTINGTVRLGMEELFHEDLRYIPCHGCPIKKKIENALLAEITARHDSDGHRFFTLTPTISDFSGPIIVHTAWYPGNAGSPIDGVVSARLVFATRVGSHLFQEFVWERRHHDPPIQR